MKTQRLGFPYNNNNSNNNKKEDFFINYRKKKRRKGDEDGCKQVLNFSVIETPLRQTTFSHYFGDFSINS